MADGDKADRNVGGKGNDRMKAKDATAPCPPDDGEEAGKDAPRVTMRVLAKGEDSEDQKFWVERLKDCGAEVIDAGRSGIVAEGPVPAFEKALDLSVEMEDDKPVLRGETAIRSSDEAEPPVAYIPSKPKMF